MPGSGSSSPYGELAKPTEVDLSTALPGLATVYEDVETADTADRRSYLSFESWDTSFSTIKEKEPEYTSNEGPSNSTLFNPPDTTPQRVATSVGDIQIPINLIRSVSSTPSWRPNLDAPDDHGFTADEIIAPQLVTPGFSRERVQSVTLGTLERAAALRRTSTPQYDPSAKNVRKTSVPLGQELARIPERREPRSGRQSTSSSTSRPRPPQRTATETSLSPFQSRKSSTTRPRPPLRTATESSLSPFQSRRPAPTVSHSSAEFGGNVASQDFATDRPPIARSASSARRGLAVFNFGRRRSTLVQQTGDVLDLEEGEPPMRTASDMQPRPSVIDVVVNAVANAVRRPTLVDAFEKAKVRTIQMQRKPWVEKLFEYSVYLLLVCFVYFVLIGRPLWNGAVWWLWWVVDHKFVISGGWAITIGLAIFYAFGPLLILFEPDPPFPDESIPLVDRTSAAHETALLIPCYKSAGLISATLTSALKIFPPENIFVVANGNSPTPLDNTEEVCRPFGVNHVWSPIGSKIVAQFVGCYAAKDFKYVLMIDDDCALPANFPIVTSRMTGRVKCMGYTIKSVGPESSKGTLCQQAQDLEYKLSGIQRAFAGKLGSATFAHGAIGLWDREFLVKVFYQHPGFSVSEDWFFGHAARQLGCRILMTTSIFVETETPGSLFFSSGGSRGGFGEMTVYKQRFSRWNFFFSSGLYWNFEYIFLDWKLGWWEVGAKVFVFQEIYETLLYLLSPFILPISFIVRPAFCGYLFAATFGLYIANVLIFNEIHLRRKHERIGWKCVWLYYMPYKAVLTLINIASCYWSLYKYATYFAKRHPKIVESEKAIEVVMRLEDEGPSLKATKGGAEGGGRRMTVVAIDGAAVRRMTAASLALPPVEEDTATTLQQDEKSRTNGDDDDEKDAFLGASDENEEDREKDKDKEQAVGEMPRIPPPAVARELRLSVAGEFSVEERRGGS